MNPIAIGVALTLTMFLTKGFINPLFVIVSGYSKTIPQSNMMPLILSEIAGALVAVKLSTGTFKIPSF